MNDIDDPDSPHKADPVWSATVLGWAIWFLAGVAFGVVLTL